jgi:hypothetical protein
MDKDTHTKNSDTQQCNTQCQYNKKENYRAINKSRTGIPQNNIINYVRQKHNALSSSQLTIQDRDKVH